MAGLWTTYNGLLDNGIIETLATRRRAACLRFANKALLSGRFGCRWFPRNNVDRVVRESTRRMFEEKRAKTDRMKNNPIQHMIKLLNEQSSG